MGCAYGGSMSFKKIAAVKATKPVKPVKPAKAKTAKPKPHKRPIKH